MVNFIKDRIMLLMLVIAGDWISLAAFIKADEIRRDAITIAAVVSLLLSLIISLMVRYFSRPNFSKKKFLVTALIVSIALWIGFIFSYLSFSQLNNEYGKVSFPKNVSMRSSQDSIIVGGCHYTPEAQAEVNDFAARKRTLTPAQLFEDFNYDSPQIWAEKDRDCARSKILNSFAMMLAFLIAGITLTCELLIGNKKGIEKKQA